MLTEAGNAAMRQADHIFPLGPELPGAVRDAATSPAVWFTVGVSDGLQKLVVWSLMHR